MPESVWILRYLDSDGAYVNHEAYTSKAAVERRIKEIQDFATAPSLWDYEELNVEHRLDRGGDDAKAE